MGWRQSSTWGAWPRAWPCSCGAAAGCGCGSAPALGGEVHVRLAPHLGVRALLPEA